MQTLENSTTPNYERNVETRRTTHHDICSLSFSFLQVSNHNICPFFSILAEFSPFEACRAGNMSNAALLAVAVSASEVVAEEEPHYVPTPIPRTKSHKYSVLSRSASGASPPSKALASQRETSHASKSSSHAVSSMRWYRETCSSRANTLGPLKFIAVDEERKSRGEEDAATQWSKSVLKELSHKGQKVMETWEMGVLKLFSTPAAQIVHQCKSLLQFPGLVMQAPYRTVADMF